jgi:hypothetical protein
LVKSDEMDTKTTDAKPSVPKEEKIDARTEKPLKARREKSVTWEGITQKVYDRIEWYATRFIILSTVGVVIGFIALVYGGMLYVFTAATLQDASVFLAVFVGVGAIVASLILLAWGVFWRRRVENRSIF